MTLSDSKPKQDISEDLHLAAQSLGDLRQAGHPPREHDRQFDSLLGLLPGSAYRALADEHWTALFVSKGIEDLTGYPPDEFTSRRLSYNDIMLCEDPSATRGAVLTPCGSGGCTTSSTASGTRTARSAGSGRAATGCFPRTGPSASSRWWNPDSQLLRQQAGNSVLCSGSRGDRKLPGAMLFRIKTRVLMLAATCR